MRPTQTKQREMFLFTSSEPLFRFSDVGQPLQGKYEVPHRDVPKPIPVAQWRDLSEEAARTAVLAGDSLLVTGPPGSGKSFWVRQLVKCCDKEVTGWIQ